MRDDIYDEPERLAGVIFHIAAILFFLGASGWGIWQAAHSEIGPVFVLYLLPALASIGLVPTLIYRLYSLLGAFYQVERDGMRLRWGLRIEDIPMDAVTWISLSTALKRKLPLPWLRWPGAVIGVRHTSDGERVEFLSSRSNQVVVIATRTQLFTISPDEPETFMQTFQRLMELGSLSPITAQSLHPSFLLARIWRMRTARLLILAGLLLNIILVVWVSLVIPNLLISAENDVSWVPHFMYRIDHAYDRFRHFQGVTLPMLPSEYVKRQVYATFQFESVGRDLVDAYGAERMMWSSDYPHTDSPWPRSREYIEGAAFKRITPEETQKIMVADKAARLYRIDGN